MNRAENSLPFYGTPSMHLLELTEGLVIDPEQFAGIHMEESKCCDSKGEIIWYMNIYLKHGESLLVWRGQSHDEAKYLFDQILNKMKTYIRYVDRKPPFPENTNLLRMTYD